MQKYQWIAALLLTWQVGACPAAAAATLEPSREDLMKAVFGQQYRPASGDALTKLPRLASPRKMRYYRVKPLTTTVLNTGETVLVAQSDYAEQNTENDDETIEDETLLNVFVLRQSAGKWTVLRRHENFMYRGENSGPGSILFPMLNKERQGLAVVNYVPDHGCSSRTLYLFDLGRAPLTGLTEGISTASSSNRHCGDDDDAPDEATTSKWYLAPPKKAGAAYNDVVVVSVTETTAVAKPGQPKPVTIVGNKVTLRYAYDGKQYQLLDAGKR